MINEEDINKLLDCHNGSWFQAAKLAALPKHIDVLNYTDTSILFRYCGVKKYAFYEWAIKGWIFK